MFYSEEEKDADLPPVTKKEAEKPVYPPSMVNPEKERSMEKWAKILATSQDV